MKGLNLIQTSLKYQQGERELEKMEGETGIPMEQQFTGKYM